MAINWSAIDNHSTRGRLVRLPLRLLPSTTVLTIRRGPAAGMNWIVGGGNHGCWLGTYEMAKQAALERFVRPGMTVYDIGAQAGFYSLFFSQLVGTTGRVYAFEPCAYEARYLLDHIRLNNVANICVIQAAVSERSGLTALTFDRGQTQNAISDRSDAVLQVPAYSLDDRRLPAPALIKMDVEGAESAVLEGARRMLREHRPVVFVALHGAEQRRRCIELLETAGYRVYELDGTPLLDVSETDEIYGVPQR